MTQKSLQGNRQLDGLESHPISHSLHLSRQGVWKEGPVSPQRQDPAEPLRRAQHREAAGRGKGSAVQDPQPRGKLRAQEEWRLGLSNHKQEVNAFIYNIRVYTWYPRPPPPHSGDASIQATTAIGKVQSLTESWQLYLISFLTMKELTNK